MYDSAFFCCKGFSPCPKRKEDHFNRFQVAPIKNNLSKWRCEWKPLLFRSFAKIFPNRYVAERNVAGILNSESVHYVALFVMVIILPKVNPHVGF